MHNDDGHISYKYIFQYNGPVPETKDQMQPQEKKKEKHGNQSREQLDAFPQVSFQQCDQ